MRKLLTRDFVHNSLYHPTKGYFNKTKHQVGKLNQPIEFENLEGYYDYNNKWNEIYPQNKWLTPSEIFKPYYGMVIGTYIFEYMANKYKNLEDNEINIIEVGPGQGSLADSIWFYFKNYRPQMYNNINYNLVEISSNILKDCRINLSKNNSKLIKDNKINFFNQSIMEFRPEKNKYYFIIFMEILDNLPHDKIIVDWDNKDINNIFQTSIEFDENKNIYNEIKEKLTDPNLHEITNIYLDYLNVKDKIYKDPSSLKNFFSMEKLFRYIKKQNQNNIYLPTVFYMILKNILNYIPNHNLIINDFDLLRDTNSSLSGINGPTISNKLDKSSEKQDFDDYLRPYGSSDIFYETDFKFIHFLYNSLANNSDKLIGEYLKNYKFIYKFGNSNWTKTKSGYQPLIEDFQNNSFFISENLNWKKFN